MISVRGILIVAVTLTVVGWTASVASGEEIEDLIYVAQTDDKIIAVIEGEKPFSFDLRLREKILWSHSRGYLGAFLTNERFIVISTSSGGWQAYPLKLNESGDSVAHLSAFLALLVTKERIVSFDAVSHRFIEILLPLGGRLIAVEADEYVAAVITSNRAYGLASESDTFTEVRFRMGETFHSMKTTPTKTTVRTSDRLLTYEVNDRVWREDRLH